MLAVLGREVFAADVMSPNGLDDRLQHEGLVQGAQQLMADAVGADHAFFSTCGSSLSVKTALQRARKERKERAKARREEVRRRKKKKRKELKQKQRPSLKKKREARVRRRVARTRRKRKKQKERRLAVAVLGGRERKERSAETRRMTSEHPPSCK